MGGQACVFYGAAEFSRDTDLLLLGQIAIFDFGHFTFQEKPAGRSLRVGLAGGRYRISSRQEIFALPLS